MLAAGLSRLQVAEACNVSGQTVWRWSKSVPGFAAEVERQKLLLGTDMVRNEIESAKQSNYSKKLSKIRDERGDVTANAVATTVVNEIAAEEAFNEQYQALLKYRQARNSIYKLEIHTASKAYKLAVARLEKLEQEGGEIPLHLISQILAVAERLADSGLKGWREALLIDEWLQQHNQAETSLISSFQEMSTEDLEAFVENYTSA